MSAGVTRREFALLALALGVSERTARASLRTVPGGELRLACPWPVADVNPYDPMDPGAFFFSDALFGTLFRRARGGLRTGLASHFPERVSDELRVTLRERIKFADGRALTSADVASSMARLDRASNGILRPFVGRVRLLDARTVAFRTAADANELAELLASSLTSITPVEFDERAPVGTGPFAWSSRDGASVVWTQNRFASEGPAFLERVRLDGEVPWKECLRRFELDATDLGWLGRGLYRARGDAHPIDAQGFGWMLFRVAARARAWSAPGVAQALVDSLDAARLASFGFESRAAAASAAGGLGGWGGGPIDVVVPRGSNYLVELADQIGANLSRPRNEVRTVVARGSVVLPGESENALSLFPFRPIGKTGKWAYLSLLWADRAEAALSTLPRALPQSVHALARLTRVGVLGDFGLRGSVNPRFAWPLDSQAAVEWGDVRATSAIARPE